MTETDSNIRETDDIFAAGADALVNPVNCEGVSGMGLALEFSKRYGQEQRWYERICRDRLLRVGHPQVVCRSPSAKQPRWIVYFPTKDRWRDPSLLVYINEGLSDLHHSLPEAVRSIAIPALGCGLGMLSWSDVKPLIVQFADSLPHVVVHIAAPR
jgi:O-acetyl-ADP-ribose deacetylase (regulator of RNase III)